MNRESDSPGAVGTPLHAWPGGGDNTPAPVHPPDLFAFRYPAKPGHRGTDTSIAAAASMLGAAPTLRALVLSALSERDMTADEAAAALGETVLAVRPRFTELARMGLIEDGGDRRANASGRKAIVWRIRP